MSRKRAFLPEAYRAKKRVCTAANREDGPSTEWDKDDEHGNSTNGVPSDTKAALLYLKGLFPKDKFNSRLPCIILQHQLYNLVKHRTTVDKQIIELRNRGEIKVFKLGTESLVNSIVFTDDYIDHVRSSAKECSADEKVTEKFISVVLPQCNDISLSKETVMQKFKFKDHEITDLINCGVLAVRDVASWWLSVPSAGLFVNTLMRGRAALLKIIRKCKYKEILLNELEGRKLPKVAKLGMEFYIHDIIGADLVNCTDTTSGKLLRLQE